MAFPLPSPNLLLHLRPPPQPGQRGGAPPKLLLPLLPIHYCCSSSSPSCCTSSSSPICCCSSSFPQASAASEEQAPPASTSATATSSLPQLLAAPSPWESHVLDLHLKLSPAGPRAGTELEEDPHISLGVELGCLVAPILQM
ncbi:uncharacterized protein LOC112269895 [Brachypodium distachyon]|uniref:Uncharacterized protein n=1 Tax=Brachypodium distachyon TaxID=15368 RepID=A0A2K2DTL7_BRADI|nr:uncharacterized protein LOC112269895 [Brachypodium distachyon]PNT77625.1 hypothetical protein BRADI_1g66142v3 [Brachypodium distachyon]|eukprot:XP_024313140.1 uncharacterized protein LOC112269895 [Brachypodium distachyon]